MRNLDNYEPWDGTGIVTITLSKGDINCLIASLSRDELHAMDALKTETNELKRTLLEGDKAQDKRLIDLLTPFATKSMQTVLKMD